jgi:hypothetical protein
MKYHVAIKLNDYSDEFFFNSESEREEFISVTKTLHPNIEIIVSEEWGETVAAA